MAKPKQSFALKDRVEIQTPRDFYTNHPINSPISIRIQPKFVGVGLIYDELSEEVLTVNWQSINGKKSHQISPIKVESQINTGFESFASTMDPTGAYDRISSGKHIINKSFLFNGTEIFGDNSKKLSHLLHIQTKTKNGVRVNTVKLDDQIYLTIPAKTKTAKQKKSKPSAQALPVINTAPKLDPEYSSAVKDLNEFNDAEEENLPPNRIPANLPDLDLGGDEEF